MSGSYCILISGSLFARHGVTRRIGDGVLASIKDIKNQS